MLYLLLCVICFMDLSVGILLSAGLVILKIILNTKNLINCLIYLESLSLLILWVLSMFGFWEFYGVFSFFFIFTLMVCEAALGLGVLVKFSRFQGDQMFKF